jgi:hypothetical protein
MDKETFRIKLENDLLKKQLEKEKIERIKIETEYRELAEYVQLKQAG